MGSYRDFDENIYYNPKNCGLEKLYGYDCADSYEFDIIMLWKRQSDGRVVMGTDSGCSCPSPFEDTAPEDLVPATPDAVREWFDDEDRRRYNEIEPGELQKALAILKEG